MNLARHRFALVIAPALTFLCACAAGGGGASDATGNGGGGGQTSTGAGTGPSSGEDDDDANLTTGSMATGGSGVVTGPTVDCSGGLPMIVRDFAGTGSSRHPDFEQGNNSDDTVIVTPTLGADNKPVYAGNPNTPTTHGKTAFDQWYNDVAGVNKTIPITIQLAKGEGDLFTYDNQAFFPIDGMGFGNEGNDDMGKSHNFGFTTEVHTQFTYMGGEEFTFSGDDDLFGYINKKLVINLGGIHQAENKTIKLDELGLTKGESYPLDLFGAERHVTQSHYRVDTSIKCFVTQPPK